MAVFCLFYLAASYYVLVVRSLSFCVRKSLDVFLFVFFVISIAAKKFRFRLTSYSAHCAIGHVPFHLKPLSLFSISFVIGKKTTLISVLFFLCIFGKSCFKKKKLAIAKQR